MRLNVIRLWSALLAMLLVAGCVAPTPAPTPAPTQAAALPQATQTVYPTSTAYPTFTPFPTLTVSPSPTPTAMATLTPTVTATATVSRTVKPVARLVTPAPKPAGSAELWHTPGSYFFTPQCANYYASWGGRGWNETFCILGVEVFPLTLRVYGHWHLKLVQGSFKSRSLWHPRSTSFAYYLVDNLGNKYVHGRTGGAADADTVVEAPDYLLGYKDNDSPEFAHEPSAWWEFAPANPGASSFTFVDDAHGVKIGPIVLSK